MIALQNDRLETKIQEVGSSYKRSRFDWSGICQQITLDGAHGGHTFCSQEATDDDLGTEGVGLIDEFGITTPIGYDKIGVGGWFPKIGVGFLQKVSTDPYDFMQDYPMQAMPIEFKQTSDVQVTFTQESEIIGGWGWILRKRFSLVGSKLIIDYALENIGEKPLTTEQYNHNFIAINGETIGPDYQLDTSFPLNFEVLDGGINVENDTLNLREIPPAYIYALQLDCAGHRDVKWSLVHHPSGHGISVSEKFLLFKLAVWAKSHVISPEFFIWINLEPGKAQIWRREYSFF